MSVVIYACAALDVPSLCAMAWLVAVDAVSDRRDRLMCIHIYLKR